MTERTRSVWLRAAALGGAALIAAAAVARAPYAWRPDAPLLSLGLYACELLIYAHAAALVAVALAPRGGAAPAPDVAPATICRWKTRNMTRGSTVIMSTSAKSRFHCELNWLMKLNNVN